MVLMIIKIDENSDKSLKINNLRGTILVYPVIVIHIV